MCVFYYLVELEALEVLWSFSVDFSFINGATNAA